MIEEVLLFQIDKTSKIAKQYSQREFDRLGLNVTVEQWILLKIIHESNRISQKELSEKSLRDPASITRTLDILQKKDLINRLPIPENRRQYNINLSKKGEAFVQTNMSIVHAHRKKSIEGLSKKDQQTLNILLKRIQENMS
ncbi:MarR family transcriptional regulator [uncultured Kriegella sp.]|uniref:MarR family winged helix-turn-helix transcriptional regulator n=1 Tax=uncultured Kriegella sp. TaxID=1798910 RepID=UPI0030DBE01D|tara:strand:+ start:288583 stop:289005 length:423 start_codon:yes stop_codon:yes gene_type:complete